MADCEKYGYGNQPHVTRHLKPKDPSYWLKKQKKAFPFYIASSDWLKQPHFKSAIWHSWEIVTVTLECHMALLGVKGLKIASH